MHFYIQDIVSIDWQVFNVIPYEFTHTTPADIHKFKLIFVIIFMIDTKTY